MVDTPHPEADNVDENSDDLESAYRRALEALDVAEVEVDRAFQELADPETSDEQLTASTPASENLETLESNSNIDARAVVEAAVFVGGVALTAKRLATLLGGSYSQNNVAELIDELNSRYAEEGRPYAIHLHEGGYALELHDAYDSIRRRVFGMGPREVKLSQEALEVLALVAYQQPLSRTELLECGRRNASAIMSQLVRRQLVDVERSETKPPQITYRTTPRFLDLFGLKELDELPHAEELSFK